MEKLTLKVLGFMLAVILFTSDSGNCRSLSFGVRSGVNFSLFTGKDSGHEFKFAGSADPDPLIRYAGGAYVNIALNEKYSLQPEVIYSQVGARWSGEAKGEALINGQNHATELKEKKTHRIDYLQIPVLLKQKVSPDSYAYAGPLVGITLSAESSYEMEYTYTIDGEIDSEYSDSYVQDISGSIKSPDLGFVAGGSLEFGHLVLDGRFIHSLVSVEDSVFGSRKNFALSLTAGLKF